MATQSFYIYKDGKYVNGATTIEIQIPTHCPVCNKAMSVEHSKSGNQSFFRSSLNSCCNKLYGQYYNIWAEWEKSKTSLVSGVSGSKAYPNGLNCKRCKELYPYAEPNQADGTLICFGCKR